MTTATVNFGFVAIQLIEDIGVQLGLIIYVFLRAIDFYKSQIVNIYLIQMLLC